MVRNTYIYPPEPSCGSSPTSSNITAREMPKFNSISISGYHMQEAGATLCRSWPSPWPTAGIREGRHARGLDVDAFAPAFPFFFAIGMNFFMEIAKLRAARLLWHRIMEGFGAQKPGLADAAHPLPDLGRQPAGAGSLNNIVRTAYEALAAVLGGTQSLHTNSFDEAIALPTDFSARIARNTQLILQHETGITKVVDPLAGSYYVERLTADWPSKAWRLIEEVDAMGGMTKAVASGMPKLRIEEAAARRQAAIDRGEEVIVGVNKYPAREEPESRCARSTTRRCARRRSPAWPDIRATRDAAAVRAQPWRRWRRRRARGRATSWRSRWRPPARGPRWARSARRWNAPGAGTRPRCAR
ncbi:MAG: hypothetical protein KatS3mg118_2707 [Paracoccaceae bacterium]|nr:MAG: hypothetical protein KatS3mg118_2707 [Paracoccaceae bacterium]